ncbi:hypothetical protein GY45DRAFT_1329897 [Cubamyces sp. BRFM 1775]|nr:hypothetical protein GY45DRAFT_1329897 [Cubamyces sp. BRFM 1775]
MASPDVVAIHPVRWGYWGYIPYSIERLQSFIRGLHSVADVVARTLGPRMQEIRLWKPDLTASFAWLSYGVARGDDAPRARFDRVLPENYVGF